MVLLLQERAPEEEATMSAKHEAVGEVSDSSHRVLPILLRSRLLHRFHYSTTMRRHCYIHPPKGTTLRGAWEEAVWVRQQHPSPKTSRLEACEGQCVNHCYSPEKQKGFWVVVERILLVEESKERTSLCTRLPPDRLFSSDFSGGQ